MKYIYEKIHRFYKKFYIIGGICFLFGTFLPVTMIEANNEVAELVMIQNSYVGEYVDVKINIQSEQPFDQISYVIEYENFYYEDSMSGTIDETIALENNSNTYSKTFSMEAGNAGDGVVAFQTLSINGEEKKTMLPITKVCTIKEGGSNNANVVDIQLRPVDIEFQPEIDTYHITVDENTEKILVKVVPEEENATYIVTGITNLVAGENKVQIKVTAPDAKTVKEYTIFVNKKGEVSNSSTIDITNTDTSSVEVTDMEVTGIETTEVETTNVVNSSSSNTNTSSRFEATNTNSNEHTNNFNDSNKKNQNAINLENLIEKLKNHETIGKVILLAICIIVIFVVIISMRKKKKRKAMKQQAYENKEEYDNRKHPAIVKKEESFIDSWKDKENTNKNNIDKDNIDKGNTNKDNVQFSEVENDFEMIDIDKK